MGPHRRPDAICHRAVCNIGNDLDGAAADSRCLAAASRRLPHWRWPLPWWRACSAFCVCTLQPKRFAEAWSHQAESPEVVAGLYAAVERMRLTSSNHVIDAAEQVIRYIIGAYAAPDRTFDDLRRQVFGEEFRDPLREAAPRRRPR
jgi:hypothetical protein